MLFETQSSDRDKEIPAAHRDFDTYNGLVAVCSGETGQGETRPPSVSVRNAVMSIFDSKPVSKDGTCVL